MRMLGARYNLVTVPLFSGTLRERVRESMGERWEDAQETGTVGGKDSEEEKPRSIEGFGLCLAGGRATPVWSFVGQNTVLTV